MENNIIWGEICDTPEAIEKLSQLNLKFGDEVTVRSTVGKSPFGFIAAYYSNNNKDNFEPIQDYLFTRGSITKCCIIDERLYIDIGHDSFVMVESVLLNNGLIFGEREITIDFDKKCITTNEGETESFEGVFKLVDCIEQLNNHCDTTFSGYDLNIKGDSLTDKLPISFGCQTGTYSQVKQIINAIKAGSQDEKILE
jgi:hypothetical protein